MVAVTALGWLPNPLVDHQAAHSFLGSGVQAGPFCLGVRPLVVAFVLVELGALILPFTRQRRRQDPDLRRRLWIIAVVLGMGVAWFQGLSLAFALENMNYGYSGGWMGDYGGWGGDVVPNPGWMFRLATATMCAAGVTAVAAIVHWLDHRGLGPGMAALLLADAVALMAGGVLRQGRLIALGESTLFFALLTLLFLAALLIGTHWLLGREPRGGGGLPAALPTTGLLPYEWAITLLLVPTTLASFGVGGSDALLELFLPGRGPWIAVAIPVVLVGTPVASLFFYWRRRRWWSGPQSGAWLRLVVASAVLMVALVLADAFLLRAMPFAGAGALGWITIVALGGDAWDELRAWRKQGSEPVELARHQDLADAIEQLRELREAEPQARFVLTGRRFRALTYFFGPYVPLRIVRVDGDHTLKSKP